MRKPGYKTSEFWFTLVSFIFSGLFLFGVIDNPDTKDDLTDVYNSRTFCLYEDIEKLKNLNLAKVFRSF